MNQIDNSHPDELKICKNEIIEIYKFLNKSNKTDEIIKNTYRTLMTRGMKGCYIYCTDKALSDYIRMRLSAEAARYSMVYASYKLKAAE